MQHRVSRLTALGHPLAYWLRGRTPAAAHRGNRMEVRNHGRKKITRPARVVDRSGDLARGTPADRVRAIIAGDAGLRSHRLRRRPTMVRHEACRRRCET